MLQVADLLKSWCAARAVSEDTGAGFDSVLIERGWLDELNKRFYAMADVLDVECKTRHLVDTDDDGNDRYVEVGMVGCARWVTDNLSNPYAVTWSNGAWGFYTLDELFDEQTVVEA